MKGGEIRKKKKFNSNFLFEKFFVDAEIDRFTNVCRVERARERKRERERERERGHEIVRSIPTLIKMDSRCNQAFIY